MKLNIKIQVREGWSASHLIFSSEPHFAQFLGRATSKGSSFSFYFLNVPFSLGLKHFSKTRPRKGINYEKIYTYNNYWFMF